MADLTTFIEKEDAVYRAFLSRLPDFDGENLSDITHDTERCCAQVFLAAERNDITYRNAMIYLAMRTNRRLIQNVRTCIDDICNKKVKTPAQAQAYIWMLLQPYSSYRSRPISRTTVSRHCPAMYARSCCISLEPVISALHIPM